MPGSRHRRWALAGLAALVGLVGWSGLHHAQGLARGPATRFANGRPDTTLIWGPEQVTSNHATNWFTEVHSVTIPNFDASKRYYLRITNGDTASGLNRVSQVSVMVGGKEFMNASDVTTSVSACNKIITVSDTNTIVLGVKGAVGRYAKFRLYSVPDPSYAINGGNYVIPTEDGFVEYTETVDKASNASAPWTLFVENGLSDGSNRCTGVRVQLNGTWVIPAGLVGAGTASVSRQVSLSASNNVTVRLYGAVDARASLTWTATDTTAPSLTVVRPSEGYVTDTATVATTATLSDQTPPMSVLVHTLSAFNATAGFTVAAPLPTDGLYTMKIKVTDRAGYSTEATRHVIRDTHAPELVANLSSSATMVDSSEITVGGAWSDTSITTVSVDGVVVGQDSSGTFKWVKVPLDIGPNGILFRAKDALGNVTQFKRYVFRRPANEPTPRDSSQIHLLQVAETEGTDFFSRARFIYTETNAYQSGNDSTALDSSLVAVVRGRVLSRDFGPLANVSVRVLDHPEYGESVTRADGRFSLVVNGGAPLMLRFLRSDFLESQRRVEVPVQDFAVLDDVSLIGRSSRSYAVNTSTAQTIVGRFESDANGDRSMALLFSPGTVCSVTTVGGQTSTYSSFNVRLKEFTVGSSGDEAMPGPLPPSSAYTYCLDMSVVEAEGLGSLGDAPPNVRFSKPIVTYVREFLGFPVGSSVPSGYYDPAKSAWMASEDGCVVRMLGVTNGVADLDINGDGVAETQARYDSIGITSSERTQVASLYAANDTLWRTRVEHFSPRDLNPNQSSDGKAKAESPGFWGWQSSLVEKFLSETCGCVIENENRVLGESIPIAGTSFALHYRSSRQPGDIAMRSVRIPLVGGSPPAELRRVHVIVDVAGKRYREVFNKPFSDPFWTFEDWDGRDAYGRDVVGSATATVRIGYEFDGAWGLRRTGGRAFGNGSLVPTTGARASTEDRDIGRLAWTTQKVNLGAPSLAAAGLGGWTISPHHIYDTNGQGVLYHGDGSYRIGNRERSITRVFAGNGSTGTRPEQGHQADSGAVQPSDMTIGPDGALYVTDDGAKVVARIQRDGKYFRLAGTGSMGDYGGDGTPGTNSLISSPSGIAFSPAGELHYTDRNSARVLRLAKNGNVYLVAGKPGGSTLEDTLAVDARLSDPTHIAFGPDGALFIADANRIRRVAPDGHMRTYAGNGTDSPWSIGVGYEGRADTLAVQSVGDMVCDSNGDLYFVERASNAHRVRRIATDGRLTTAIYQDELRPSSLAIGPDGMLYVAEDFVTQKGVFRRESDGTLSRVAGGFSPENKLSAQNGQLARATAFAGGPGIPGGIKSLTLGADGALYVGQTAPCNDCNGIFRIAQELPGATTDEIAYPSEDGRRVDFFTLGGRHKRTQDAMTGFTLYSFGYDAAGRLLTIVDSNGDSTRIHRDGSGVAYQIVAPRGQTTELTMSSSGKDLLGVTNPNDEAWALTYEPGRLLSTFTNPRGKPTTFQYSAVDGRLESEVDASGGGHALTLSSETGPTRIVSIESEEGRTTQYTVMRMLDGLKRHFTKYPDGSSSADVDSMSVSAPYGEVLVHVGTAGERSVTRLKRDARFSWLAPVMSKTVTTLPSGLQRTDSTTRATAGNPQIETVLVNGNSTVTSYTASPSILTTTTPEGRTSQVSMDAAGRPTSVQVGTLAAVSLEYGANGRLELLRQGGRAWRYSYDAKGRLAVLRDTLQRMTQYQYDNSDRVTSQSLPGGRVVSYAYDANGNLTSLTPPGSSAHGFAYTDVDLNESYTPPSLSGIADPATDYSFNLDRQLTRVTRPDGALVRLVYDATRGRLDSVTTARGGTSFGYWDVSQPNTSKPSGQLKTVNSPDSVTLTYAYDGPLLQRESWSGRVAGVVERGYDSAFRDSVERVIVGAVTDTASFSYDRDGLLVRAGQLAIHRRGTDGMVDSTKVGQVTNSFGYDSHGDVSEVHYSVSGTGLFHQHLERDSLGRIVRIDQTWSGSTTSRRFAYDAAGRLEKVMDGAGVQIRRYVYDGGSVGNGNRTAERGASDAQLASASYDAQDRLLSYGTTSYVYTAAGELTLRASPDDTLETVYDALGNLVTAGLKPSVLTGPNSSLGVGMMITYQVDGLDRRVRKIVNDEPVQGWLYRNGLNPVAELDGSGALKHRYVYATRSHVPDLLMHADTAYRMVTDHLGSVRAVVRASDGLVVQRFDYDAWGVPTLVLGAGFQSLGYAGGLTDAVTKLVRFGARDYEPTVARWTAKDPTRFGGRSSNLYSYVASTPLYRADPTGTAHFGTRPLTGFPGRYYDTRTKGSAWDTQCNCEALHEQLFFDDDRWPSNIGFGNSGIIIEPDSSRVRYDHDDTHYDDDVMREVVKHMEFGASDYALLGNNCQVWAARARQLYAWYYRVLKQKAGGRK